MNWRCWVSGSNSFPEFLPNILFHWAWACWSCCRSVVGSVVEGVVKRLMALGVGVFDLFELVRWLMYLLLYLSDGRCIYYRTVECFYWVSLLWHWCMMDLITGTIVFFLVTHTSLFVGVANWSALRYRLLWLLFVTELSTFCCLSSDWMVSAWVPWLLSAGFVIRISESTSICIIASWDGESSSDVGVP